MLHFLLSNLANLLYIPHVLATALDGVNNVSGPLTSGGTASNILSIIRNAFDTAKPLFYGIAVLVMMIAGVLMVAKEESADTTATVIRTFISAAAGLILLLLIDVIQSVMSGAQNPILDTNAGTILSKELIGVVNYATTAVGVIAILFMIISGIQAIFEFGSGEGTTHIRQTVISVMSGILVLLVRGAIVQSVYIDGRPDTILTRIIGFIQQSLNFLGVIAVAIIMYAGLLMILNVGNDEQYKNARTIIMRVVIGLIIILVTKGILSSIFGAIVS